MPHFGAGPRARPGASKRPPLLPAQECQPRSIGAVARIARGIAADRSDGQRVIGLGPAEALDALVARDSDPATMPFEGAPNLDAANLVSELKRRRVFRVLVGYGIVSFAVLQVVEPIMHALHLQDAVLTYTVLALALGFPV